MREVKVPSEQAIYRARVESRTTRWRKRVQWRVVIERLWSKLPGWAVREEDWQVHKRGRWVSSLRLAEQGAEEWLDKAESRNPAPDDYV